jgi:DNA primase
MRDCLLDFAGSGAFAGRSPRPQLEAAGFSGLIQKLDPLAAHASHWCVKAEAAEADAEEILKQALTLHHRAKALNRELHLAELALGKESSEANLARLKDIQEQLLTLGGTEAAVEGFGDSSKRFGAAL